MPNINLDEYLESHDMILNDEAVVFASESLAHSWGTSPKQKAREKEYNHQYYEQKIKGRKRDIASGTASVKRRGEGLGTGKVGKQSYQVTRGGIQQFGEDWGNAMNQLYDPKANQEAFNQTMKNEEAFDAWLTSHPNAFTVGLYKIRNYPIYDKNDPSLLGKDKGEGDPNLTEYYANKKKKKKNEVDNIQHFNIPGSRWHHRRFQYEDGSLTPAGRERYGVGQPRDNSKIAPKKVSVRQTTAEKQASSKKSQYINKTAERKKALASGDINRIREYATSPDVTNSDLENALSRVDLVKKINSYQPKENTFDKINNAMGKLKKINDWTGTATDTWNNIASIHNAFENDPNKRWPIFNIKKKK